MFQKYVIFIVLFSIIYSAKILVVVPFPSISHQVVFRPLTSELINRGHEVTVITTDPAYPQGKAPNNLTEIDIHDVSYTFWNNMACSKLGNLNGMLPIMTLMFNVASKLFEVQLKDKSIQKLIRSKTVKFDLLIVEAAIAVPLIFTHIFKAPVIQMTSHGPNPGLMEMIGAATHPFLYPLHFHERIYNLTIWEKMSELYKHVAIDRLVKNQELQDDIMLQGLFGIDTPPLSELKNNVDMLFLNAHPIWVHNQPVPPNVVYIWGIHRTPEQLLPKDLQSYLDSSKTGVIYISFGTNVKTSSIASDKLEILLKVFSQLPYNILWKWDTEELPGKSENIEISKWFPQCDVLRHPNVKLFITQGGLQSTEEAINAGVPLIGIPFIADQTFNTAKYEHYQIGIQLNFAALTEEKFENAIKTILTNDRYSKNIVKLRTLMRDQPKPSLENAIWWIDYVLRHGGARHLRTPAANMSWTQYYELELVFVILSGLTFLVTLSLFILYSCYRYTSRVINLKNNKNKNIKKIKNN